MRWLLIKTKKNKSKLDNQIGAIANVKADIVALQEVSNEVATYFKERLPEIGLEYVETSHQFDGPSQYGVLIASLHPLEIQPSVFNIPWQKCALSAVVRSNYGEAKLHAVHVPNGSNHRCRKIEPSTEYMRLCRKTQNNIASCAAILIRQTKSVLTGR